MAQYHKGRDEFVNRNNELYDVVLISDGNGNIVTDFSFTGTPDVNVADGNITVDNITAGNITVDSISSVVTVDGGVEISSVAAGLSLPVEISSVAAGTTIPVEGSVEISGVAAGTSLPIEISSVAAGTTIPVTGTVGVTGGIEISGVTAGTSLPIEISSVAAGTTIPVTGTVDVASITSTVTIGGLVDLDGNTITQLTPSASGRDASGKAKSVEDRSLFYSTWTYRVSSRIWEEFATNWVSGVATPKPFFANATSQDHMLSVTSGTISNEGICFRSKRHIRYKPNRGQLFSAACVFPAAITSGTRELGLFTIENGLFFRLSGNGSAWTLNAVRRKAGNDVDVIDLTALMDPGFDPEKTHVYDIQYDFNGEVYNFFVDRVLIYTIDLTNLVDTIGIDDPALPVSFCSNCVTNGVAVDLRVSSVDVSTEGGSEDRTIFSSVNTGNALLSSGVQTQDTAVIAVRIPRTVNYNGVPTYNSRGVLIDKLVTWCRDESYGSIWVTRDMFVPQINGLAGWQNVTDSNVQYIIGGNSTPLSTAFNNEKNFTSLILKEFTDTDTKNEIVNPSDSSEYYLTPGDILIVGVRSIGNGQECSATIYFSEEF